MFFLAHLDLISIWVILITFWWFFTSYIFCVDQKSKIATITGHC